MNYSRLTNIIGIVILLTVGIVAAAQIQNVGKQYQTAAACAPAMRTANFTNCYATQARLHTEFLCSQDNTTCWAEVK